MNIVSQQITRIHALKKNLCWDDETYRDALWKWFKVKSCKDLSYSGANRCIQFMTAMLDGNTENVTRRAESNSSQSAISNPTSEIKAITQSPNQQIDFGWGKEKYECLGFRKGFATPRELRMLNAMWSEVTRAKTARDKDKAFDTFLQNKFKIGSVINIKFQDVARVKHAIEEMKAWAAKEKEVATKAKSN